MLANWIKATTTTTGTGAITLTQVTGFPAVGDWFSDGAVMAYAITDSSDNPVESGIGTYIASGTSLARSMVQATYASATLAKDGTSITAATLAGTSKVYVSAIAGAVAPGIRAVNPAAGLGMLVGAFVDGLNVTGGVVAANRLYVTEYKHQSPRRVLGFRAFVGTASGNIRFGLYRINNDGSLGKLVVDTGSKATVANVTSYALSTPVWLPPDNYACAVIVDNTTASFRLNNGGYSRSIFGCDVSGFPITVAYTSPGSFTLPDPFSGSLTATAGSPLVFVELQ